MSDSAPADMGEQEDPLESARDPVLADSSLLADRSLVTASYMYLLAEDNGTTARDQYSSTFNFIS